MSNSLVATLQKTDVIKATGAVHISASRTLTLTERKIVNILLKNAYHDLLKKNKHTIKAAELVRLVGLSSKDNLKDLRKALVRLTGTTIEFNVFGKEKNTDWMVCSFLSQAKIKEGICIYEYSSGLRELLYNPKIYARLDLLASRLFSSKHAHCLWEFFMECLCTSNANKIYTPWIFVDDYLQKILGLHNLKYKFKDINRYLIKNPILEINNLSDIEVKLPIEYQRQGRKVIAIRFLVERKKSYQPALDFNLDNIEKEDEVSEIEVRMMEYGLSKNQARQLFLEYGDRILENLDYVESQKEFVKNVGAYTVKSITEDFRLTEQQKESIQEEEKNKKEKKELKERSHEEKQKDKDMEEKRKKKYQEKVEKLKELSEEDFKKTKDIAIKNIKDRNPFLEIKLGNKFFDSMLESEMVNVMVSYN